MDLPEQKVVDEVRGSLPADQQIEFDVFIAQMRVAAFNNSPGARLIQGNL